MREAFHYGLSTGPYIGRAFHTTTLQYSYDDTSLREVSQYSLGTGPKFPSHTPILQRGQDDPSLCEKRFDMASVLARLSIVGQDSSFIQLNKSSDHLKVKSIRAYI